MESKLINTIEQYILFAFGNKQPKQIYSQLLSLEGQELIDYVISFISGELLTINISTQLDVSFENVSFETWYYHSIKQEETKGKMLSLYELFELNKPECNIIINKVNDFHIQKGNHSKDYIKGWKIDLLTDYLNMYLTNMNAIELKEYIISIVDPIQPK
jgi:hypothetical protein